MSGVWEASAAALIEAEASGAPIPPLRDVLEPNDEAGAYAIQNVVRRYWLSQGRTLVGRKIGLTSEAVQRQLGVDRPDYGALYADMRVHDGGRLAASRLIQPKAEAEIALVLSADLADADIDRDAVARATSHAIAAIEIVDSRIADWKITFADTVADNGSTGCFVLGSAHVPLDRFDPVGCTMMLEQNGVVVSQGSGAACLGDPLVAAAWLARTLSAAGDPLRAGDVILTGALGPMVTLQQGDTIAARIDGLGTVSFSVDAE